MKELVSTSGFKEAINDARYSYQHVDMQKLDAATIKFSLKPDNIAITNYLYDSNKMKGYNLITLDFPINDVYVIESLAIDNIRQKNVKLIFTTKTQKVYEAVIDDEEKITIDCGKLEGKVAERKSKKEFVFDPSNAPKIENIYYFVEDVTRVQEIELYFHAKNTKRFYVGLRASYTLRAEFIDNDNEISYESVYNGGKVFHDGSFITDTDYPYTPCAQFGSVRIRMLQNGRIMSEQMQPILPSLAGKGESLFFFLIDLDDDSDIEALAWMPLRHYIYNYERSNSGRKLVKITFELSLKEDLDAFMFLADRKNYYTKTEIDAKLRGVMNYKGSVETYDALLLIENPEYGDVYNITSTGENYIWAGEEWDYITVDDIPNKDIDDMFAGEYIGDLEEEVKRSFYTKNEVDQLFNKSMKYCGSVKTYTALPKTGNKIGDTYDILDTDENYIWNGADWDKVAVNDITGNEVSQLFNSNITAEGANGKKLFYTAEEIDDLLAKTMNYYGSKDDYKDLPAEGNKIGDTWNVKNTDQNYIWTGTEWDLVTTNAIEENDVFEFLKEVTSTKDQMKYKGSVETFDDLPKSGLAVGDTYNISSTDKNYIWTGEEWDLVSVNDIDKEEVNDLFEDIINTVDPNGKKKYYTAAEIDSLMEESMKYKHSVDTYDDLPTEGVSVGDTYDVLDTDENYIWNGTKWDLVSVAKIEKDSILKLFDDPDSPNTNNPTDSEGYKKYYTAKEIDALLSNKMNYCGSVNSYEDLPTANHIGDTYDVLNTDENYIWNGTRWDRIAVDSFNSDDINDLFNKIN